MKNTMKTMILGFLALVFALGLSSCGDKSEDPTPQKTDLDLVKEGIAGSYWNFVSNELTKDGVTIIYNGECSKSSYPTWIQNAVDVGNIDFHFINENQVELINTCLGITGISDYTVTEVNGKIRITLIQATTFNFELITPAKDFNGSSVVAQQINGSKGKWTFTK